MDFKKITPGYPCSDYIVKKISTPDELWSYAKMFAQTASERGVSPSEIIPRLIATLSSLPISSDLSCPNFKDYGSTDEEICQYLINNPTVPSLKNCSTLYKKIDSHTGACRICEYSKLYRNQREEIEYSILKFMLTNESNLNFVADYINEEFFTSCMDVSMGIPVIKAYILPMPKILAQSLLKNNIRLMLFSSVKETFFMSDNPFDIVWEDAYRTFPRNRKIPANLSNNPMWQNVLKMKLQENIENAKVMTRQELIDIFNDYILSSDELRDTIPKKQTISEKEGPQRGSEKFQEITLEDIIISMKPTPEPPHKEVTIPSLEPAAQTNTQTASPTLNAQEEISPPLSDELEDYTVARDHSSIDTVLIPSVGLTVQDSTPLLNEDVQNISSEEQVEVLKEKIVSDSSLSEESVQTYRTESGMPSTESTVSATTEISGVDNLVPSVLEPHLAETLSHISVPENVTVAATITKERENVDTETSEIPDQKIKRNDDPEKENVAANPEDSTMDTVLCQLEMKNLIQLPVLPDYIRKEIIIHVRKNKKLPAPFYQGVLRDKELDIEVVRGSNRVYLYLMWSRHIKKFITMNVEECTDELKKLLSYKSIKKICHTPYILYGVCKLFHIPVKNIFSIQTVHGRLFPAADALPYIDLCKTYQTKSSFGSYVTSEMTSDCPFLGGMPLYKELHNILLQMIQAQGSYSLFMRDAFLDEALGCSYFYGLNFADKGTLLLLIGNNKFYFNKNFSQKKITEGRCHSYYVKEKIDATSLLQYLLQRLAEKGIFRTTSLQVLGMDRQQLLLFVEKEQEEYVSSLIDLLAFEYGHTFLHTPLSIYNLKYDI